MVSPSVCWQQSRIIAPAVASPDTTEEMGRNYFHSAFRLTQPSLLSAASGPHFRRLQVVLSHTRDEPGGRDVVTRYLAKAEKCQQISDAADTSGTKRLSLTSGDR